jgi:hypothetical protein
MSWNITGAPGTGEDLLYSQAGTPTLDLRFASSKSLNDYVSGQNLITYTRASDATFFDSNGTIQTAGANTPRFDHNPATGESLGLLIEEARTNLLLNSETLSTQSVTVTAAAHTLSFYGTGTVTLSGTHSATVVGTGAFPTRTTLTFTPTSGSLTVTVSGTVQYAQVELGAFATSWISTAGATATRNGDVASITGANFSRWYSRAASTVFSDSSIIASSIKTQTVWELGGGSNSTSLRQPQGTANQFRAVVGGTFSGAPGTGPALTTGVSRASVAFEGAAARLQVGSDGVDITASNAPDPNLLQIGNLAASTQLNGHIRRLAYFDRRLPNATLQAITA